VLACDVGRMVELLNDGEIGMLLNQQLLLAERSCAHLASPILQVRPKFSRRRDPSDRDPPSPNEPAGDARVSVCLFFRIRSKRDVDEQVTGVGADPLDTKADARELVSELILIFV
jgi:hypothetical protein